MGDDTIEEFLQRRTDYLYLACPVVAALSGVLFFAVWTAPSPTQRAIMMAAARMKANIAIRFMLFKRRSSGWFLQNRNLPPTSLVTAHEKEIP